MATTQLAIRHGDMEMHTQLPIAGHLGRVPQKTCLLLEQPIDVLREISSHLDPVSAASLALACTATLTTLVPQRQLQLSPRDRRCLLELLEREPGVGNHLYYCHFCDQLHPFDEWWGPGPAKCAQDNEFKDHWSKHCLQQFRPPGSNLRLGYHHARLVMSRHFYGAPCGLPLGNLNHERSGRLGEYLQLDQTLTARIINDTLFVRCTHRIYPKKPNSQATPEQFRNWLDHCILQICNHVTADRAKPPSCPYLRRIPELKFRGANQGFVPCRRAPGCCKHCSTDFETTIEGDDEMQYYKYGYDEVVGMRNKTSTPCSITIVTYHVMGRCRTPWGVRFRGMFDNLRNCKRNMYEYPPGAVQQRWLESEMDATGMRIEESSVGVGDVVKERVVPIEVKAAL